MLCPRGAFYLHDGCSTRYALISRYNKAMPNRELILNMVPNGQHFYKALDETIVVTWTINAYSFYYLVYILLNHLPEILRYVNNCSDYVSN